jgi:biopolymer transport protein ExbB
MGEISAAWNTLRLGGPMVYPLLAVGVLAFAVMLDRGIVYFRCLKVPEDLAQLAETYVFSWEEFERRLEHVGKANAYGRFFSVVAQNRNQPAWWVESRAQDEAGVIEKVLSRGLWLLETTVTAAPLMGLFGTITGMMQAFNVIGTSGLVAPHEVTAGVAQALIATALGLLIAIIALFGFNFFSRMQSQALDRMERLGSKLVDRIRVEELNLGPADRVRPAPTKMSGGAR